MSGELNPLNGTGSRLPQLYQRQRNKKVFSRGLLTTSFVKLYDAPTGSYPVGAEHHAELIDIVVCNGIATQQTFSICILTSGGTPGQADAIFWLTPIAAKTSYFMNVAGIIVPNGYAIYAKADAGTAITLTLQGDEVR